MALQTLDFALFTHGNNSDRQKFASDLLSNLSRHGFVKLRNHGVSEDDASKLWKMNESFFNLSKEEKCKIANVPGPNPQRGWSSLGAESSSRLYQEGLLKSETKLDLKDAREHFDMGSKDDHQYLNKWPDERVLPGFRATMEYAFDTLESISAKIMEALEVSLKLPCGTFLDKITHLKNASEFRFNHYPAIDVEEINSGLDNVGGLECENREISGTFSRIKCDSTSDLIVNISETLQRWSNDRLPAGLHRVSLPQEMNGSQSGMVPERYSIAYFCKADRDVSVGPLKEFVPENTVPRYREMSAIEYQKERLQSAY